MSDQPSEADLVEASRERIRVLAAAGKVADQLELLNREPDLQLLGDVTAVPKTQRDDVSAHRLCVPEVHDVERRIGVVDDQLAVLPLGPQRSLPEHHVVKAAHADLPDRGAFNAVARIEDRLVRTVTSSDSAPASRRHALTLSAARRPQQTKAGHP